MVLVPYKPPGVRRRAPRYYFLGINVPCYGYVDSLRRSPPLPRFLTGFIQRNDDNIYWALLGMIFLVQSAQFASNVFNYGLLSDETLLVRRLLIILRVYLLPLYTILLSTSVKINVSRKDWIVDFLVLSFMLEMGLKSSVSLLPASPTANTNSLDSVPMDAPPRLSSLTRNNDPDPFSLSDQPDMLARVYNVPRYESSVDKFINSFASFPCFDDSSIASSLSLGIFVILIWIVGGTFSISET